MYCAPLSTTKTTLPLLLLVFWFLDVSKYIYFLIAPNRIFFVHWGSQSSVSSLQMMAATEQIRNVNAVGCSAGNAGLCRIDESFGIFVVEGSKPIERFLYLFGKYHELT